MGIDYRCDSCGLTFTVGWDHYHRIGDFSAETKLVCTECGTCHVVRHAIAANAPDALLPQPGPLFTHAAPEDITYDENWRRCEVTVDLRPVRQKHAYLTLEGVTDALNLANVECAHCHASGSLTDGFRDGERRCPHCRQQGLQVIGCWMT